MQIIPLSTPTVQAIIGYLYKKPYGQVFRLVAQIESEIRAFTQPNAGAGAQPLTEHVSPQPDPHMGAAQPEGPLEPMPEPPEPPAQLEGMELAPATPREGMALVLDDYEQEEEPADGGSA